MDGNTGCRPQSSDPFSGVTGEESKASSPASPEAGGSGPPGGTEGMERIRVRARTLDGKAVSMVGLLPRNVLEDLKARIACLESRTGRHYHLEAHLKSEAAVEVRGGQELEGRRGLKVVVGVAIKEDAQTAEHLHTHADSGETSDSREEASVERETTSA